MPVIAYGLREGYPYNILIHTKHLYDLEKIYGGFYPLTCYP